MSEFRLNVRFHLREFANYGGKIPQKQQKYSINQKQTSE